LPGDRCRQAPQLRSRGSLLIAGGNGVSLKQSPDNSAYWSLQITGGFIPIDAGDYLQVTYTTIPTVEFFPDR
jgi:hypothetical protein